MNDHEELIEEAESWVAHTKPSVIGAILRDMISALESVRAERDAALAAIERLRNRHRKIEASAVTGDCATEECEHEEECPTEIFEVCSACWNLCESADPYFGERGIEPVLWPCEIETALDGAPEPEWEYGTAMHMPVAWKGGSHCTSEESREAAELRVASAKVPAWLTRRRKAGPWLLVEGESKP